MAEPALDPSVVREFMALEKEAKRRFYLDNPEDWIRDKLGYTLWSKQREICQSVVKFRRTAVPSCFDTGKSFIAGCITAWWVDVHPVGTARVVTTAPTGAQIKAILWTEIHRAHSAGKLPGRLNQTEWWMPVDDKHEEMVAFGRKPQDMDQAAFQGIHAPYVLAILDEAAGIPPTIYEGADAITTGDKCRQLLIGNPEDAASEFANACAPGSGNNVIRISAFDTPNFTGEDVPDVIRENLISQTWVEDKTKKWGIDSPMYRAKILGEFPQSQEGSLIPIAWIHAAQERTITPHEPVELGVDVGGGGDRSVITLRQGGYARVLRRDTNPDTMQTCGNVLAELRKTGATVAKVDEIGIGKGVVDRATETFTREGKSAKDCPIVGINVGRAPTEDKKDLDKDKEQFVNFRAKAYWHLREIFEAGTIDIDPADEDLAHQLTEIRFIRTSSGKIQIESKEQMKRRGRPSPDDADSLMLAFCGPPTRKKKTKATWGRRRM